VRTSSSVYAHLYAHTCANCLHYSVWAPYEQYQPCASLLASVARDCGWSAHVSHSHRTLSTDSSNDDEFFGYSWRIGARLLALCLSRFAFSFTRSAPEVLHHFACSPPPFSLPSPSLLPSSIALSRACVCEHAPHPHATHRSIRAEESIRAAWHAHALHAGVSTYAHHALSALFPSRFCPYLLLLSSVHLHRADRRMRLCIQACCVLRQKARVFAHSTNEHASCA